MLRLQITPDEDTGLECWTCWVVNELSHFIIVVTLFCSPRNGTAVSTDFQVKCSEWKGGKFPLTYKISYRSPVRSSQDKKEYEWILWYQGNEQASPLNSLPAGRQEDGYKITVIVEIEGRYGEYVKQSFSVKVFNYIRPSFDAVLCRAFSALIGWSHWILLNCIHCVFVSNFNNSTGRD